MVPATRSTTAPRSRAASATATPMRPLERLPMKRTGSMGSAVPPAVTRMRRPSRSRRRPPIGSTIASTTASRMAAGSARRPRPDAPDASSPTAGSTMRYPNPRSRSTLARVAGCAYISPSIAGATTTGARAARQVIVITSSASPPAMAASQRAVAGATTMASARSPAATWAMRWSGRSASGSRTTGRRLRVSNVRGPTKCVDASVMRTCTSAPSEAMSRSSSTAL